MFVGRLAEKKGVPYLIEAMEEVDAVLAIVGDGPLKEELEQQGRKINELSGWNKVRFLGSKTHEELKEVYASADIFVCPSITAADGDQEGLGLVILEAMASELPVVATNSGGIPQIIKNNINGLLCEEKNAISLRKCIEQVLYDEELRSRLTEEAYKVILQYSYENIGDWYKNILRNI